MRSVIIRAACIAAILGSPWIASSQQYYVVVGAFAADENASEFKGYLPGQELDTSYTDSGKGNLLHFYVLKTSDKQSAISKTLKLKQEIDAWRSSGAAPAESQLEGRVSGWVATAPVPEQTSEVTAEGGATASEGSAASGAVSAGAATAGKIPAPPVGKYFNFKIESPEGRPIPAQVHHVDFDNGLELAAYKANTFVDLLKPGHADEPMTVVCGLFGYKEIHKYIDYTNPSATDEEAFVDSQGVWVIPYKLERVEKGDVSVMYNVSFYKDAVVMRKKSKLDLDELVKMMHSNPYYEITIHAHCNGKSKREIIAPGPDRNYFDVAGSVKLTGSAKDLTMLRAEAIQSYLVDHGIDASRTNIFAWGGSDMLVKSNSPHANLNDRIEIEFTRD
jgi:outer membrane protein OmpA-like peptidoglycan-associated protein